jgi:restriction system protein
MPRRRRNNDLFWARAITGITMPLVGLSILIPGFRNAAIGFGIIVFVLAIVLIIGFLIYQFVRKKRFGNCSPAFSSAPAPANRPAMGSDLNHDRYLPPDHVPRFAKPEVEPMEWLRKIDWFQFEIFVAYVYEKRGFYVRRKGGANPDGGVDLIIEKDGQRFAVQCKQWKTWNVGVKAIREFLGALTDSKIQKGIFITLEGYTGEAKQLAEKHGIEIINEAGLRTMMNGLNLRDPKILEIFNDARKICPKCESEMVLRTARKGPNAGGQFWGCQAYPQCGFTMPC